jgi:thymidylate kinase
MNVVTEPAPALEAVTALFASLNGEAIRYCQWKSTRGLPKALLGKTDFDLLVGREHIQRFKAILQRHDFKPFISHPSRQYPGIEDYLGFDAAAGKLIHLHVHYRVVLGEEYVKNYYPPLEEGLLEGMRLHLGIRIPPPEHELIILSLRALLKYRDRDALRDALGLGSATGIAPATLDELRYLLGQTSPEQVAAALTRHAGFLPPDVILDFLKTIGRDPRDARVLVRLRGAARHTLAPYRLRGQLRASLENAWIMLGKTWPFDRVIRRVLPKSDKHKTPASGGLAVAFIGADGAGKSTIIKHVVKWLSWRMVVKTYYMGSARPSAATRVFKGMGDVAQIARAGSRRLFGERGWPAQAATRAERFCDHLRYLGDARDRYQRFLAGQRDAARGAIVVYDRFPLDAVRIYNRTVDGPRIAAGGNGHMRRLDVRLAAAEEQIYRRIHPPDHVFVLHVSPDVSQARKPEHPRERIEAKSLAIKGIARGAFDLTDVDADQPLDQVLLQIKSRLWRLL